MIRTLGVTLCFIVFSVPAFSQIVNIESLRARQDSAGFTGSENLGADYTRNTNELLTLTNNLTLQYKKNRNVLLFLNTYDVSLANSQVLEQNTFFHLRYNYRANDWLTYEALTQYQSNVPLRIQHRWLTGIGPRFTLLNKENNRIHFGSIFLYEYDAELNNDTIHRDFRLSSYLSYQLHFSKKVDWSTVVYYQPRVEKWEDFRTSIQTKLSFKIFKNLAFTTIFNMSYDAFPVNDPAIPNLTVKWSNGISYSF